MFSTSSETVKFLMQACTNMAISQALNTQLASAVESPSDRVVYKPGVLSPSILISGSKRMAFFPTKELGFTMFYILRICLFHVFKFLSVAMCPAGVKIRTSVHCANFQFYHGSLLSCCGQDMSRVGWHLAQKCMTHFNVCNINPKSKLCGTDVYQK